MRSALTIGGLDPSGGAGIAADLRAFTAAGVWGCAACAALTVQSTRGVRAVYPVASRIVLAQARELLGDVRVSAIKTGALGSPGNVRAVARLLAAHPRIPSVVDPVMRPSRQLARGVRLDGDGARATLALVRSATLVTPNFDEAAAWLGEPVDETNARDAAAMLVRLGARAALVKGGHGRGPRVIDWFATKGQIVRIARRRVRGPEVHGTGCMLAALVAGRLAAGPNPRSGARRAVTDDELIAAVRWARGRLSAAFARPLSPGTTMRVLSLVPLRSFRA